jgi:hypothetical protein
MVFLLVFILVYSGTFLAFWLMVKNKKRSQKYIRLISLFSLCPIIISAVFISDELANIIGFGGNKTLFHIITLFVLIYGFRLFQDFGEKESD